MQFQLVTPPRADLPRLIHRFKPVRFPARASARLMPSGRSSSNFSRWWTSPAPPGKPNGYVRTQCWRNSRAKSSEEPEGTGPEDPGCWPETSGRASKRRHSGRQSPEEHLRSGRVAVRDVACHLEFEPDASTV